MYTGPTCWPWAFASLQSVYVPAPSELSTTSLLVAVFQQTCEPSIRLVSTLLLGAKVPFCFHVILTHLYLSEEDVPANGAMLATVVTAPDGGAWALPVQGTPVVTPV